jgi:twinkle protein
MIAEFAFHASTAPITPLASSMKMRKPTVGNPQLLATDRLRLDLQHAMALEERRGLPCEITAQLGIVSRGKEIGFQYLTADGRLSWTKWRGSEKQFYIEPKGVKLIPWNLPGCHVSASVTNSLIITEGEIDAASCVAAGFPASISVPNGAPNLRNIQETIDPLQDHAFSYLWTEHGKLLPELAFPSKIILAGDNDGPGLALIGELATRLGVDRCYMPIWPEGCKDASDVLQKFDAQKLRECLLAAIPLVPDKLVKWSELPATEQIQGIKSGWGSLDAHLLLTFPELVIVTGKPGSGKSRWTLAWVMNLARIHRVKFTYVSLEDSHHRLRRHALEYAKHWEGKERTSQQTGEIDVPIEAGKSVPWLDHYCRFVAPSASDEDTRDLEWVRTIIWEAACRHDCKILVLDPWNELEHLWAKGSSEVEYINAALRDLKRMGRRYGITLIILAHPDKNAGLNQDVDDMSLYSINGGAPWNNKADCGIIIGREIVSGGETGNTVVKICKRKDQDVMGILGKVTLKFNAKTGQYTST